MYKPSVLKQSTSCNTNQVINHKANKHSSIVNLQSLPLKVERIQKALKQITNYQTPLNQQLLHQINIIRSELTQIKMHIGFKQQLHFQIDQQPQPIQQIKQNSNTISKIKTKKTNFLDKKQRKGDKKETQIKKNNIQKKSFFKKDNKKHKQQQQSRQEIIEKQLMSTMKKEEKETMEKGDKQTYELSPSQPQKQLLELGKIQPYLKDFKLETTAGLQAQYFGYHKKSSRAVIVKYCQEQNSMEPLIQLYEKLWRSIVKARKVCINKVYQLKDTLANNIMVLQRNKSNLLKSGLPLQSSLRDVLRALQFIHQCGYLYRNIHPSHVMVSETNEVILIDFKRARRLFDHKGKHMEIIDDTFHPNEFVSNACLKNIPEGRKDDLECIGYLALFFQEQALPWTVHNLREFRSTFKLNQIFSSNPSLLQFMTAVQQLKTHETPDYDAFYSLL